MAAAVATEEKIEDAEVRIVATGAVWPGEFQEFTGGVLRLRLQAGPLGVLPLLELGTSVDCMFRTPEGRFFATATVVSRRGPMLWFRVPPAGIHEDRRRARRVVGGFPVDFSANGASGTGTCLDISTGGMRLRVPKALPVRAAVDLKFRLAAEQASVSLRGSVAYTAPAGKEEGCDVGIEFKDLPSACRELIARCTGGAAWF